MLDPDNKRFRDGLVIGASMMIIVATLVFATYTCVRYITTTQVETKTHEEAK